ncbi:MAG: DUF401 family protein [Lachnospiraceae bacterium]|nr:DUF401 family protein [Lachnospiraceae bacterium]
MDAMVMDVLKLLVVFAIIILVMWYRQPLRIAIVAAMVGAVVLYRLPLTTAGRALWLGAIGKDTIQSLLVFYTITFLQRMMEKRRNLSNSQVALNGIFNNRRINASLAPFMLGCLPAASTVLICGPIVRESVGDYLNTEEKAAITSYFRHISESFLPTYTTIFIAISLTNGRVTVSQFLIAMLPMVVALFLVGYVVYLRRIPKDTGMIPDQLKRYYWILLAKSIWAIALAIALILVFNLPVYIAVLICIVLNVFVNQFSIKEILPFFRTAFEGKLLLSTALVMMFKEILGATGVITELPEFFSKMPLPEFLIFALIFFIGSTVAGSQAIIVLCMPMAMASLGNANALPLFILLMCMNYVAMQISPVHICLTLCAEDYRIPLGRMVRKTMPMVVIFSVVAFGYYFVLNGLVV